MKRPEQFGEEQPKLRLAMRQCGYVRVPCTPLSSTPVRTMLRTCSKAR